MRPGEVCVEWIIIINPGVIIIFELKQIVTRKCYYGNNVLKSGHYKILY